MALADYRPAPDFGDAAAEARSCRTNCALFDFSFLECARVAGKRARSHIENFTGRSLDALREKGIRYALRAGQGGEILADLTVWRLGPDTYEVMSGRREDVADLLNCAGPELAVTDMTGTKATFALQGPRALEALRQVGDGDLIGRLGYFTFAEANLAGISCIVGRLGYTGEAGFEIIAEHRKAPDLWRALSAHAPPAGFVAADILRIEAGFVLFANEFRFRVLPNECGLEKFYRPNCLPKPEIELVSFRADADRLSFPWQPACVLRRPDTPGTIVVTSACNSVVAGGILGLGYVPVGTTPETILQDPAGIFRNIRVTPMPIYDPAKQRPRALPR